MWSWKKCTLVSLRAGLFTAVLMSVFWYIWSVYAPVPELSTIELLHGKVLTFPFHLSRWSDVVFAPLLVAMMLTCYGRIERKDKLWFGVVFGLLFGVVIGLIVGLIASLGYGLFFGVVFGVVFGLALGLDFGHVYGLGYALGYVLGYVLGYILALGLIYGVVVGVVIGLAYGLVLLIPRAKVFLAYITGSKE